MKSKPYCLFPRTPYLFSSLNVQRDMLRDNLRLKRFKEAIFQTVRSGDVVIDLGTGTGILAIWAARAGAKRVFAIEETDVAAAAEAVVNKNGLQSIITVLRTNSTLVRLPEPADVLIAELVGHFLFEEGIVEYVSDVRNSLMKPGARIIPTHAGSFLAPISLGRRFGEVSFWKKWRDPDLSVIAQLASNSLYVEELPKESLLADPQQVFNVDFLTVQPMTFRAEAAFEVKRHGRMDALGGWFNLFLTSKILISTAPGAPKTHWKQCVVPLDRPKRVVPGDVITCQIAIEPFRPGAKWQWSVKFSGKGNHQETHEFTIMYDRDSRLLKERF